MSPQKAGLQWGGRCPAACCSVGKDRKERRLQAAVKAHEVGNKVRDGSQHMKALCARLRSLDFISQDTDDAELCDTGPN